jgi:hypothetical protein
VTVIPITQSPVDAAMAPNSMSFVIRDTAPMDLSPARRRLSPEERQKRIDEVRCLYCGGFHHLARDCPNETRDPGRPLRGAVAEATVVPEAPPTPIMEPGKE